MTAARRPAAGCRRASARRIGGGIPAGAYGMTARVRRARCASSLEARGHRRRGSGRHPRRQRGLDGGHPRDARPRCSPPRSYPRHDRPRHRVDRGRAGRDRRVRRAVAGHPARVRAPSTASARPRRTTAREAAAGRRLRAAAVPAPARAQPRHPDDAVPQHGAHVPGDDDAPTSSVTPSRSARRSPSLCYRPARVGRASGTSATRERGVTGLERSARRRAVRRRPRAERRTGLASPGSEMRDPRQ